MEGKIKKTAVVIGGINMDIGGSPAGKLLMRDSNPGTVTLRPGGVGRNIAHNLCLLGMDVSFVAALGGDVYAQSLLESCGALGMDMSMSLVLPRRRSSVYLYVSDEKGDMQLAISDMDIVKCISPEHLKNQLERINRADAVVMDANISCESLEYLAGSCTAPMYSDTVSAAKAPKLRPYLHALRAIKPNILEAQALSGERDPERAARYILRAGTERVFISLGREGMLAASGNEMLRIPAAQADCISSNGAGDAAAAAVVWADSMGCSLRETAEYAVRAGAITTECIEANNPELYKIKNK